MEEYDYMSVTWNTASETVFTEVTGTFSFLDDNVRAAYIDWDDGISNNKEEANFQWYTTPTATSSVSLSHTYTATGTYQPIVQTVNSDGYTSKYIGSKSPADVDISPYTSGTSVVTSISITDGQGTGLLRTENKTVKSGIDNSIFDIEGPKQLYAQLPPIMGSSSLSGMTFDYEIDLGVTMGMAAVGGYTFTPASVTDMITVTGTLSGGTSGDASGSINILETAEVKGVGAATSGNTLVNQVLSFKYKNPKRITADFNLLNDMNKVKIFLVASSSVDGFIHPITYVSPGAPIKRIEDKDRSVTLDFTQSRAMASNVGIKQYRYDLGKSWFNPSFQWDVTGNYFNDNTVVTGSLRDVSYTFMPNPYGYGRSFTTPIPNASGSFNSTAPWTSGNRTTVYEGNYIDTDTFALDDFGRFPDQYHLARMSVQPSSAATLSSAQVSSIADNKPIIFRINPQGELRGGAADRVKADVQPRFGDYTSGSWYNGSGNSINIDSLTGEDTVAYTDLMMDPYHGGGVGGINERLLLLFDNKTNKIFLNISPHAPTWSDSDKANFRRNNFSLFYMAVQDPNTIKQKVLWKPLKYENTTNTSREYYNTGSSKYEDQTASYSKSGYINFDMPSDWASISMGDLCGGRFRNSTATGPSTPVTNDFELVVSGQASATINIGSPYGKAWNLSGSDVAAALASGNLTSEDIGAYRYMFTVYADGAGGTGPTVGNTYWVASGADNGYVSSPPSLSLMYGDISGSFVKPTTANAVNGVLRRINVYDVVDGMSKIIPASGTVGAGTLAFDSPTPERSWPVDYREMGESASFPNKFVEASGQTTFDSWSGSAKYPLKIVMSPTQASNQYVELWDIFDAKNAFSSIIKEEDDSAYNLNSMSITSDISYGRSGKYYEAITRKGKVYIIKTGIDMHEISFTSVATGDENAANAFTAYGAHSSLYGHLHTLRRIQSEVVRIYWDEIQKDGTYVRFWGIVKDINETHGASGPRAIRSFDFTMGIENIALLDSTGTLMTDIFPLGGILDDKDFT